MPDIIEKAREKFDEMIKKYPEDIYGLVNHLSEMEKWAKKMLEKYSEAEKEVVFLAVWLHDIGHYPVQEKDHAIIGEERAREFLAENGYNKEKLEKVLHCVRSHRCKDVQPETIEAKIIAFCDSASHMTDYQMYLKMIQDDRRDGKEPRVFNKLSNDYRDLGLFPEMQKELTSLYEAWKKLLEEYNKIQI